VVVHPAPSENLEDFRRAVVEKPDMAKVDARIDRKYQEIVSYLHQAIKVAGDDEVRASSVHAEVVTSRR
jgi:hypothetical protein